MTINPRPTNKRFLRGQIIVLNTYAKVTRGLVLAADIVFVYGRKDESRAILVCVDQFKFHEGVDRVVELLRMLLRRAHPRTTLLLEI